jgi:hypothetical protein
LVKGGASAFLPRRPVRVAWSTFRRQTGPRRILADSVGAMLPACSAGSYQCLSKRRCEQS